jgi:hypothetical protein
MKPNNQHSTRIWNLFTSKIGSGMTTWNLTQWLPFSDDTVTFILNKPNFFGVVSITESENNLQFSDPSNDLFIVSFQGFNWAMHATTVLDADAMVSFVDKLGNEPKVEGHRAPQDVNFGTAAGM